MTNNIILVTAATGTVGKLLVHVLLEQKYTVRPLVRSADSDTCREFEKMGVQLCQGDLNDLASLRRASEGAYGVFINTAATTGSTKEATACIQCNLRFKGSKNKAFEESVKNSNFEYWTILRPCTFMDNFFSRVSNVQFTQLRKEHRLVTTLRSNTKLPLVDTLTIAKFCEAAFTNPEMYKYKILELAPEAYVMEDIAASMTRVLGINIESECVSQEVAIKKGCLPPALFAWEAFNILQPQEKSAHLQMYPVKLNTLDDHFGA